MKRLSIVLLSFLPSLLVAHDMADEVKAEKGKQEELFKLFSSTNTYKGVPITSENILEMSPEVPADVREFIQAWMKLKPEVAAIMSGQEAFEGDNPVVTQDRAGRIAYMRSVQKRLEKAGLKNLSESTNTVVQIDDFIIKASGLPNRMVNIATGYFGKTYGQPFSPEQWKEFKEKTGGDTEQTISRLAYLLRAREACETFGLNKITVPDKYPVQIPGRPKVVADTNYVVVENKVKNVVADLQDHPLALDREIVRQLTMLIGYTALWNHVGSAGNVFVVKDAATGELKLCYHDTEQPNVHSPADFFHKKPAVHFSNVRHGWNELNAQVILAYKDKLCTSIDESNLDPEKKEFLKELVNERVQQLLKEKKELEEKIAANFPKEEQGK